ncbi:hypothetical protein, partial [Algoriphagus litoralis]|uniref:hypothetical protein n=1 Tax=Algoriphagus litoralis TaxID=2202829 RepID=UPI0013001E9C
KYTKWIRVYGCCRAFLKMRYGLLILFFTWTINSFGQGDSTSIYYQALKHYNDHLDKLKSGRKEIFIEGNSGITEKLPAQIGQRQVTIMTFENQKEVYNRNNNKIAHVKIFPAQAKDDLIEVNFTPYFGEYKGKKKGYFLQVSDWVIIQFKYDCEEKKFKYWNTETGGI